MAFIGRERELAAVGAALQRSSQRELTRVAISGPLGIGITRMLDELEARIAKASDLAKVSIVRARSLEPEAGIAYAGLRTALGKEFAEEKITFADASLMLRGQTYDIDERILGVEKTQLMGKIERARTSLGSLVLKAPIGGMIVYKKNWRGAVVGVGDTLWPGNVIMSIVDPTKTALRAFVLEKDAAGLEAGAMAEVRVDGAAPGSRMAEPGRS